MSSFHSHEREHKKARILISCLGILASIITCQCQIIQAQTIAEKRYQPELIIQIGHNNWVYSVAFSPDGKTLASESLDHTIKLWNVETGQELRSLVGFNEPFSAVAFSPDGKTLASVDKDHIIKLWNIESGKELKFPAGHSNVVSSVAFSPDGKTLASGSRDKTIKLWSVESGKELKSLVGHTEMVTSIAFSPDGKILASGSDDKTIKLWNIETGQELKSLVGHTNAVRSVAFSPDSKILASGSYDKTIKLWNVNTGQELKSLVGHTDSVYSVAYSPDSKTLASGSVDHTIKLWNIETGQELKSLVGHTGVVNSVAFSPDGKTLASGSTDHTIKLWSVKTDQESKSLVGHTKGIRSAAYSPDGKTLALGGDDKIIKLWSVDTGQQLKSFAGHGSVVNSVAYSPNSKTLASGSDDKTIKLWNIETGRELKSFAGHTKGISSVAFSPDGKTLASGSLDHTIKLWNIETGQELRSLAGHTGEVWSVAFSPDGKTLASASSDHTAKLWNVETGQELKSLAGHTNLVNSVSFSPDGKTLVSGSWDKTIKLWNVDTGQELKSFPGDKFDVFSATFSPDGKILASGSSDHTIKLWNVNTGQELTSLVGHSESVTSVAFSPDGKYLLSGSNDATTKIWKLDTNQQKASLISIDRDDWVVTAPDGRFDASPGALKLMHFVVFDPNKGFEVITLDQLKSKSFTPGLLRNLVSENIQSGAGSFSVTLYPDVEAAQSSQNQSSLNLKLENRGGGVGRVEVYLNGSEFSNDVTGGKFKNTTRQFINLPVQIPSGKLNSGVNKLEIFTWNSEDDVRSRSHEFYLEKNGEAVKMRGSEITGLTEGKLLSAPPDFYAIVAGISDYAGDNLKLRFAAKDAEDINLALSLGAGKLFCQKELSENKPCDKVHLRLLNTEKEMTALPPEIKDFQKLSPTKANFQQVFAEIAQKAKPEDIVVIYLAGHGTAIKTEDAKQESGFADLYLYPTQEAEKIDAVSMGNKDLREHTTISSLEIANWVKVIKAQKKAMIFDTCAAGAVQDNLMAIVRADDAEQIRALDRLRERTGFYVLMGSAADKVSYEANNLRQGLLTYSLLEAMSGAKLRDDKFEDVEDWFKYAEDKVNDLAEGVGGIQKPYYFKSNFNTQSFDIGEFQKNEREKIPLAHPVPLILRPVLLDNAQLFDSLNLAESLIPKLRELSLNTKRSNLSTINYVSVLQVKNGIAPSGLYTVTNEDVTVQLTLRRDGAEIGKLEVKGTKNDIIDKLLQAIIKAAQER